MASLHIRINQSRLSEDTILYQQQLQKIVPKIHLIGDEVCKQVISEFWSEKLDKLNQTRGYRNVTIMFVARYPHHYY